MPKFTRATQVVRDIYNTAKMHVFIRDERGRVDYRQAIDHSAQVMMGPITERQQQTRQSWSLCSSDRDIDSTHGYAHLCELQGRKINSLSTIKQNIAKGMRKDKREAEKRALFGAVFFSRGIAVSTIMNGTEYGDQYDQVPQAKITQKLLDRASNEGAGIINLYGSHDAADSVADYHAGYYEPMASEGYDVSLIPAGSPSRVYTS